MSLWAGLVGCFGFHGSENLFSICLWLAESRASRGSPIVALCVRKSRKRDDANRWSQSRNLNRDIWEVWGRRVYWVNVIWLSGANAPWQWCDLYKYRIRPIWIKCLSSIPFCSSSPHDLHWAIYVTLNSLQFASSPCWLSTCINPEDLSEQSGFGLRIRSNRLRRCGTMLSWKLELKRQPRIT